MLDSVDSLSNNTQLTRQNVALQHAPVGKWLSLNIFVSNPNIPASVY